MVALFLELLQISFVLKSANLLIISKLIAKAFSFLEIAIHFLFVLSLESLGFFARILLPIAFCLHFIPNIWLRNSKLNGGQLSKFLKHKLLSRLKNGLSLRNPNPKSPQKRLSFGLNLYQILFLDPKLLQKTFFLQTLLTKHISKESKNKLLKHCLNLQILTLMKMTQPRVLLSNKMNIRVMGSHTLPLSNGTPDYFQKPLFQRN